MCVAAGCSVLKCVVVCCSVLQCDAVSCVRFGIQCVAVCCSMLRCVVVCCSVLCGLEYDLHRQHSHALSCQASKCLAKSDLDFGLSV